MYAYVFSVDVSRKPPNVRYANSTQMHMRSHGCTLLYGIPFIPKYTKHPLDHCVSSTGRTLGLADVHCFSKELVEPLNYKYLLPLVSSHILSGQTAKISIVSVFCEVLWVRCYQRVSSWSFTSRSLPSLFLHHYAA